MEVLEVLEEAAVLALALVSIGALAWRPGQDDPTRPRKARPEAGHTSRIQTPVIIDEGGDLGLYESIEAAERSCEAVDVWNGEYVAFDASGRRLSLHVDDEGLVWMEPAPDSRSSEHEVCEAVRRYLRACRPSENLQNLSLRQLLHTARRLGLMSR